MSRVVHFEIGANDVQRASRFYQEVFGWTIQPWAAPPDYLGVTTGPATDMGIDGAIVPRMGTASVVNTISVADLDAAVAAVVAHDCEIQLPPMVVPGIGRVAYALDTEGNLFGMIQPDPRTG